MLFALVFVGVSLLLHRRPRRTDIRARLDINFVSHLFLNDREVGEKAERCQKGKDDRAAVGAGDKIRFVASALYSPPGHRQLGRMARLGEVLKVRFYLYDGGRDNSRGGPGHHGTHREPSGKPTVTGGKRSSRKLQQLISSIVRRSKPALISEEAARAPCPSTV